MSQYNKHTIPASVEENALINAEQYREWYQASIKDPESFWREHGKIVDWIKPYNSVKNTSFDPGHIRIRWFEEGTLNVAANCLDRHLATLGDQTAIVWEGDDATQSKTVSYSELHQSVCRFANVLKSLGIKKGDVVAIYIRLWCRKQR